MPPQHPPWVTLLWLGHVFISVADGCYRRAAQRITTPYPATTTSTVDPSHKEICFPEEITQTQCLHGGSCFAVVLNDGIRSSGCSCTDEWWGERCQYRFIDPEILAVQERNMRTAHIAAGVSVCILVVFVILLAVYVYIRYRRKERLYKDHLFEASAEELYRRPFSGRSSIVESMSRIGSVRRPHASSGEDSCMVDGGVSTSADNGDLGHAFTASAVNLRYIDEVSDDFTLEPMNSTKETGL